MLFHNYLIKKYGHKAVYLGKGINVCDLEDISEIHNVNYFVSAFLYSNTNTNEIKYFESFFERFKDLPLVFSTVNNSENTELSKLFKNFIEINTISEFSSFLKEV